MMGRETLNVSAIPWTVWPSASYIARASRIFVWSHLELRSAGASAGAGGREAVVSAFDDEVVLELGDCGEHVEEQPSARSGGIDALRQRTETDTVLVELVGYLLQVLYRAAEPVQSGNHERVSAAEVCQCLGQRCPGRRCCGGVASH